MIRPLHNEKTCVERGCEEPLPVDAQFPFCPFHLDALKRKGRPNDIPCPGAIFYDHAMRQQRIPCQNKAVEPSRFCQRCQTIQREEQARARAQGAHAKCPTCGQERSRSGERESAAPTRSYGHEPQRWRDRQSGND